jgi:hypothetical protein
MDSLTKGLHAMSRDVYYHQRCPVCSRMLQIRVQLLGRRVYCQHCGGGFLATDEPSAPSCGGAFQSAADRADELLERAALVLEQAGMGTECC